MSIKHGNCYLDPLKTAFISAIHSTFGTVQLMDLFARSNPRRGSASKKITPFDDALTSHTHNFKGG